jgi:hypothetical protein
MRQDMQELPFIFDLSEYSAEICNPDQEAACKHITSLTIDEAITFRQADFFPGEDDKRQYILPAKIDTMFRRALWALTEAHPKTISSNNRFVSIALGAMICNENYYHELHEIKQLYSTAINSDDDYMFDRADTHSHVKQQGELKRVNIGFTQREKDRIETMADEIGLSVSGLLVIFFWIGINTSTTLDDVFFAYGKTIVSQFKKHINSRLYNLKFAS